MFGSKDNKDISSVQYSANFGKPPAISGVVNNSVSSGVPKNETPKKDNNNVLGSKPNFGIKKSEPFGSNGDAFHDRSGSQASLPG